MRDLKRKNISSERTWSSFTSILETFSEEGRFQTITWMTEELETEAVKCNDLQIKLIRWGLTKHKLLPHMKTINYEKVIEVKNELNLNI